jgi:hypothetical protein
MFYLKTRVDTASNERDVTRWMQRPPLSWRGAYDERAELRAELGPRRRIAYCNRAVPWLISLKYCSTQTYPLEAKNFIPVRFRLFCPRLSFESRVSRIPSSNPVIPRFTPNWLATD